MNDCFGNYVGPGKTIAYATGKRIWVGNVIDILKYVGDHETTVKVQIQPFGHPTKMTFDFISHKMFVLPD